MGARHASPQVPLKEMDAFEGADAGKLLAEVKGMVKADRVSDRHGAEEIARIDPKQPPPETLTNPTRTYTKKAKSDEKAKRKSKSLKTEVRRTLLRKKKNPRQNP